jgi:hypothetical protein
MRGTDIYGETSSMHDHVTMGKHVTYGHCNSGSPARDEVSRADHIEV